MNDLLEIGGHYTYYEKNPCMQNYMISSRKKMGRQRRKQWKTELQRTFVLWLENGASIKKADGRGV